jgi:hypothetical protein
MEPEFILRNHERRTDEPDPRLALFDKNLPPSELLPERDLSIRANDLDTAPGFEIFHISALSLIRLSAASRT